MKDIIAEINLESRSFLYLGFSVLKMDKERLTIAASADFIYYHNFEIIFTGTYAIIGTLSWVLGMGDKCIELATEEEILKFKNDYWALSDLTVYKFNCQDTLPTYVIAKDITLVDKVVYY
jgi:hypothetical protein